MCPHPKFRGCSRNITRDLSLFIKHNIFVLLLSNSDAKFLIILFHERVHMNLNLMIEMTPSLLLHLSWSLHNFYNRFAFCISIFYCHCLNDPCAPSLPWDRHSATEIIHHIRFALCRPPRRQHAETMTLFFSCSGG